MPEAESAARSVGFEGNTVFATSQLQPVNDNKAQPVSCNQSVATSQWQQSATSQLQPAGVRFGTPLAGGKLSY